MSNSKLCTIADCGNPYIARGMCRMHYQRWKRFGDPLTVKQYRSADGAPLAYILEVAIPYQGNECLTWPFAKMNSGQGAFRHDGKTTRAHRYICEYFNGPPPTPNHEAAHSCGKGHLSCVTPKHLSWKTHIENEADKIIHGTLLTGEKHNMAKLTEAQALEILNIGRSCSATPLARRYGVSNQAIYDIRQGRTWKWLGATKDTQPIT